MTKFDVLKPRHLVPSHSEPISGEEKVYDVITHYRNAIQFVNDQAIRFLNMDFEIDEIVRKVVFPPSLASHPYLQEYYGTVSWSVLGVINGKRGWFGGDPVDIFLLSKQERAERFKELGEQNGANSENGIINILNVAEQRLKQSRLDAHRIVVEIDVEIQWSLELSMTALRLTEPHTPCTTEPCSLHVLALSCLLPRQRIRTLETTCWLVRWNSQRKGS